MNGTAVLNSGLYYLLVSTVLLKQRARDLFPGMRETCLGWDTLIRCTVTPAIYGSTDKHLVGFFTNFWYKYKKFILSSKPVKCWRVMELVGFPVEKPFNYALILPLLV